MNSSLNDRLLVGARITLTHLNWIKIVNKCFVPFTEFGERGEETSKTIRGPRIYKQTIANLALVNSVELKPLRIDLSASRNDLSCELKNIRRLCLAGTCAG
jgi:hypothetical protein